MTNNKILDVAKYICSMLKNTSYLYAYYYYFKHLSLYICTPHSSSQFQIAMRPFPNSGPCHLVRTGLGWVTWYGMRTKYGPTICLTAAN